MVQLTFVLENLKVVASREPAPNWTVQVTDLETGEQSPTVTWSDPELQAVTHLMIGETDETADLLAYEIAEPLVQALGPDFRVIP